MSTHQKMSEIGWMYHSPAKPAADRPIVEYPPPSQIPGLGAEISYESAHDEPKRKMLIKDTDSPYIRLAKQGGREDLLCIRENSASKKEPVGYPRNEWFYLEDNAMEDAEKDSSTQQPYQFLLPEYMVHQDRKKSSSADDNHYDPKRLPYGYDKTTVFQREGSLATDKKVKLEEAKRDGYGVRSEKLKGKKEQYNVPKVERGKAPPESMAQQRPKVEQKIPHVNEKERPVMGKLLSFGYQKDWIEENNEYHAKVERVTGKMEQTHLGHTSQSEKCGDTKAPTSAPKDRKSANQQKSDTKTSTNKTDEEKEMFKLSKFKNVPARTETHRHNQSPNKSDAPPMVPVASQ